MTLREILKSLNRDNVLFLFSHVFSRKDLHIFHLVLVLGVAACSDEQAGADESASSHTNRAAVASSLLLGQEVLLVGLVVSGPLVIGVVREGTLGQIVELIRPAVSGRVAESIVHPVRVLSAVSELVVVDRPKALSQQLGVHARVQRILRHIENVETRQISSARVLLSREVLYKNGSKTPKD